MWFRSARLRDAANENDTERVTKLLDKGANPDARDSVDDPILIDALRHGSTDAIRILLARGARPNPRIRGGGSLMHIAATAGQTEIARLLLEANPGYGDVKDADGNVPLHLASANGRIDIVKMLLARGPELVGATNKAGDTALHMAAFAGQAAIAELLIDKGASPLACNGAGRTPLSVAQQFNHMEIAELLRPLTPVPARKPAVSPDEPADEWKKLAESRIAHVMIEREIGYRVTEVFNFESRERLRIVHNIETKSEQVEARGFDDFTDLTMLEKARLELQARGGVVSDTALGDKLLKLPRPPGA